MLWAILRSPSFYPIKTQCQIIIACCLLHNLIRREMSVDPIKSVEQIEQNTQIHLHDESTILSIDSSNEWTVWKNNLAKQMFNGWRANRSA